MTPGGVRSSYVQGVLPVRVRCPEWVWESRKDSPWILTVLPAPLRPDQESPTPPIPMILIPTESLDASTSVTLSLPSLWVRRRSEVQQSWLLRRRRGQIMPQSPQLKKMQIRVKQMFHMQSHKLPAGPERGFLRSIRRLSWRQCHCPTTFAS